MTAATRAHGVPSGPPGTTQTFEIKVHEILLWTWSRFRTGIRWGCWREFTAVEKINHLQDDNSDESGDDRRRHYLRPVGLRATTSRVLFYTRRADSPVFIRALRWWISFDFPRENIRLVRKTGRRSEPYYDVVYFQVIICRLVARNILP